MDRIESLISEEKRLKDSIDSLASAHMNWREQTKKLKINKRLRAFRHTGTITDEKYLKI